MAALSEAQIREIVDAVQQVAAAGWGQVSIVIERGRPVRLQRLVDEKLTQQHKAE